MLSRSVPSSSMRPHGRQPTRLLCPWDSPGKNTRVGCYALLREIFKPCLLCLLYWQVGSLALAPPGPFPISNGSSSHPFSLIQSHLGEYSMKLLKFMKTKLCFENKKPCFIRGYLQQKTINIRNLTGSSAKARPKKKEGRTPYFQSKQTTSTFI